ncbi:MAG TPA: hypothetical protein VG692_12730 [Gemmatimonadales bacterium]|nr:hypothetical protein [Gemmatimonadales bacterium]
MAGENLPERRIDRTAIERIIQRATELQTGERDLGDSLSPQELFALGKEVGIPERYLQQAMLEERSRTGPPVPAGLLDKTVGSGTVTAERVVRGAPEEVEQRLLRYFEEHELLTIQRRQPGRITWEPLGGVPGALRRSSAVFQGNRPFMLAKAGLVGATVLGLEPGFCHVALSADLRGTRAAIVGGGAAMVSIGLATAAILVLLSPFAWVAAGPLAAGAGAGWGVLRQYRSRVERAQLGLERALDHLERGEPKPAHALPSRTGGIVGAILDEVRRAMQQR